MANFFKDYHTEIRAKREAEENAKARQVSYNRGQIVYINPIYDSERNGRRYFVDDLSNGCVLLAKTKKEAMSGYGYIYDVGCIVNGK